jgi:hypothetical protein
VGLETTQKTGTTQKAKGGTNPTAWQIAQIVIVFIGLAQPFIRIIMTFKFCLIRDHFCSFAGIKISNDRFMYLD